MLTRKPARLGTSFAASKRSVLTFTLLAMGFGVAGFLAHPGIGVWPLGLVMFVPLLHLLDRGRYLLATQVTCIGGAVAWSLSLCWVPNALVEFSSVGGLFSWLVYAVVVLVQAVPYGVAAACAVLLKHLGWPAGVALAVGLAASEALVPSVLPYSHSVALIEAEAGRNLLAWGGREIGTALVVLLNWCALLASRSLRKRQVAPVALWAVGLAGGFTAMSMSAGAPEGREVAFGFVQSGLPGEAKRSDPEGVFQSHAQASPKGDAVHLPEFLIWGETALSRATTENEQRRKVETLGVSIPVLFGAVIVEGNCAGECAMTNSVLVSRGCGETCRYDKQELVPIAERRKAERFAGEDAALGRFVSSERRRPVEIAGLRVGTPVCFEAMFPDVVASLVNDGARILVNVVSSSWLGSSMGDRALEGLSRLSAVEQGVPLIRVVDRGASSVWDPRGRLQLRTGEVAGYYAGSTHCGEGLSFYSRHRWQLLIAAAAIVLAIRLLLWALATRCPVVHEH